MSDKRLLRLALISFGVLGILLGAGCGAGGGGGDSEIVLWEQRDPQERKVMEWALEEFRKSNPEVEINVVHYDTENLRTQFQTAALAGGGPDLVYGPSDQIGPFSILQIIKPLDDYLPEAFFDRLLDGAVDRLNNHTWAVPDQVGNHLALCYNKSLVPEPPKTFDELIAIAKKTTKDTDGDERVDQYGLVLQLEEPFWLVPFLTAYGGWVMNDEFEPTLDNRATVQALQFLKTLKVEHEVVPRESDYQLMDTLFKQGKAAMIINGAWSFREYIDAGIDLGIARLPRLKTGGAWAAPMIGSKGYSINANLDPAKKTAVMALLEHLVSVEVTSRFATELGILPSIKAAYENPAVRDDPVMLASKHQWEVGRRMPVVPEMRVIWDAMRPNMQAVMNGSKTPEKAARDMQGEATQKIAAMKRQ